MQFLQRDIVFRREANRTGGLLLNTKANPFHLKGISQRSFLRLDLDDIPGAQQLRKPRQNNRFIGEIRVKVINLAPEGIGGILRRGRKRPHARPLSGHQQQIERRVIPVLLIQRLQLKPGQIMLPHRVMIVPLLIGPDRRGGCHHAGKDHRRQRRPPAEALLPDQRPAAEGRGRRQSAEQQEQIPALHQRPAGRPPQEPQQQAVKQRHPAVCHHKLFGLPRPVLFFLQRQHRGQHAEKVQHIPPPLIGLRKQQKARLNQRRKGNQDQRNQQSSQPPFVLKEIHQHEAHPEEGNIQGGASVLVLKNSAFLRHRLSGEQKALENKQDLPGPVKQPAQVNPAGSPGAVQNVHHVRQEQKRRHAHAQDSQGKNRQHQLQRLSDPLFLHIAEQKINRQEHGLLDKKSIIDQAIHKYGKRKQQALFPAGQSVQSQQQQRKKSYRIMKMIKKQVGGLKTGKRVQQAADQRP